MRYIITDELWAAMEPLVNGAKRHKGGQPPAVPDRMFFEALLYLARTGIPLRDLPGEFGSWDAVYNRFRRWVASGALARLFEAMTADPQFGEVRRAPPRHGQAHVPDHERELERRIVGDAVREEPGHTVDSKGGSPARGRRCRDGR